MTAKYPLAFALLASAAWAADVAPRLNVRPGMWESSMTIQMTGVPPIPADLLARMTPEQRAMLESRMKSRESQGPKTTVNKRCITQEDLAKALDFSEQKGSCQRTVVSSTASKEEIRIECHNAGIKASGTVRIEAADPEHVKVSSQITSGEGPKAMKIDANGTGKWLSATCTSTEK